MRLLNFFYSKRLGSANTVKSYEVCTTLLATTPLAATTPLGCTGG